MPAAKPESKKKPSKPSSKRVAEPTAPKGTVASPFMRFAAHVLEKHAVSDPMSCFNPGFICGVCGERIP